MGFTLSEPPSEASRMRFASLIDRFERLRARTAKRVEALSAASTDWRMNRKVGLTFGAIALAMVILGLVSVGSLAVIRSSVGVLTDRSQANPALPIGDAHADRST